MKVYDYNREWDFTNSSGTMKVNLPHDAMLKEMRDKNNPSSGASAYFGGGKYSYKKILNTNDYNAKTYILHFGGVYQNAKVLLNGEVVAERPYGYSEFFVDLTNNLIDGNNEIEVIADNEKTPNSRFYSGAGIYREVHLLVGDESYILPNGIKITTENNKKVNVKTKYVSKGSDSSLTLRVSIYDGEVLISESCGDDASIDVENPKLWSAENPYLYTCKVELISKGEVIDESENHFGFRSLSWSGKGFFVNGNETLLRGACIHHDNGILGSCAFRDAEYRRVRILKDAGFNAIRSAHNPVSEALLDAADELGMYIMDETWDYWFIHKNPFDQAGDSLRAWWKKDVDSLVMRDYNHPAVVMYSIGNEISELGTVEGQKFTEEVIKYIKEYDNTRAITCGINLMLASMASKGGGIYSNDGDSKVGSSTLDSIPTSAFFNAVMNKMGGIVDKTASTKSADKVCDVVAPLLDIPGYNYATSRYKKERKYRPNECYVGSETLPPKLYDNWALVKEIPGLAGDFMWTGWDYLGETGLGTLKYVDKKTKENAIPGLPILSGSGVIDITGHPLAEVGWNKSIWGMSKGPVIAVNPIMGKNYIRGASMWRVLDGIENWSWEGCEGIKTTIRVYTEGDKVALYLNDKKIGVRSVKKCQAVFKNVKYQKGTLKAVSYDESGREIGDAELVSAEKETKLTLHRDRDVLRANGQDLCFIEVSVTDEKGTVKANSDREVLVKVEGEGTLQGFGSAVPNTNDSFLDGHYRTYQGRALIAVRSGYKEGEITVKVETEGIKGEEIKLRVGDEV